MMKKKLLFAIFVAFFVSNVVSAQVFTAADSLSIPPQVDSALLGRTIYEILPPGVTLHQSEALRDALQAHIDDNASKQFNGYRIRIYLNSVQTAREESRTALRRFQEAFPEIPAYLTYSSPNFRVMVGNFRTRTDAELALKRISELFPSATIVRDKFKYPDL